MIETVTLSNLEAGPWNPQTDTLASAVKADWSEAEQTPFGVSLSLYSSGKFKYALWNRASVLRFKPQNIISSYWFTPDIATSLYGQVVETDLKLTDDGG